MFAGSKGHSSQPRHLELLRQIQLLIPADAEVILLRDGEFDGVELLEQLARWGWGYMCRTAKNTLLYEDELRFSCAEWGVERGQCLHLPQVWFTDAYYGPLMVISWWLENCNFFVNLMAGLIAYCRRPNKPSVHLDPSEYRSLVSAIS